MRVTVIVASSPGISTSSRTTRGRALVASATAPALSPASPTTTMSLCASRIPRTPSRNRAWSSTIATLMRSGRTVIAPPCERYHQLDLGSPAGLGHYADSPAHQVGPFPHGKQAPARGILRGDIEPRACILDPCPQLVRCDVYANEDDRRVTVGQSVPNGLSDDEK